MKVPCAREEEGMVGGEGGGRGGVRPKLGRFGYGEGIKIFNYGFHKYLTPIIANIKNFVVVNFFDICRLYRVEGDCPSL